MKVYIHIGLHKTGTTYLQYNIFPSLQNFHYVQLPPWRILTKNDLTEQELTQYKAETLKDWDQQKNVIISNEYFSGAIEKFTKRETVHILDNLKLMFPEAQIIMVLRNPKGYFNSLYNFRVVTRGFCTKSMSEYYSENRKHFVEKFDYDYLLKAVSERFAKRHIIKYEQIKDNNEYVAFVCRTLDIPVFEVSNEVKENTSSKKGTQVKTHLVLNKIFMTGLLEYFPESRLKNYLKVKYFNFKQSKSIKKISKKIEKSGFMINKENKLTAKQEQELDAFVKRYDELQF
ncbi:sulfotransferase [Flavobacterium sp. XGLA_31]|uniref:sulfotransferase n=1 Tax=Flavobacterium sp. XGLA_31 TaxID=3447666 RepID=UPI003F3DB85B